MLLRLATVHGKKIAYPDDNNAIVDCELDIIIREIVQTSIGALKRTPAWATLSPCLVAKCENNNFSGSFTDEEIATIIKAFDA